MTGEHDSFIRGIAESRTPAGEEVFGALLLAPTYDGPAVSGTVGHSASVEEEAGKQPDAGHDILLKEND